MRSGVASLPTLDMSLVLGWVGEWQKMPTIVLDDTPHCYPWWNIIGGGEKKRAFFGVSLSTFGARNQVWERLALAKG